jgi:predicted  nucleic acid-binding Zn-ribbon protein
MNQMMRNLFELQALEFEETVKPNTEELIKELRAKVPAPVLAHYQRLCDSGKKGVALLKNHTCAACHMSVPVGVVLSLKRGTDVCLCGNCGRYLYLPEEPAPAADAAAEAPRITAKAAAKGPRLVTKRAPRLVAVH